MCLPLVVWSDNLQEASITIKLSDSPTISPLYLIFTFPYILIRASSNRGCDGSPLVSTTTREIQNSILPWTKINRVCFTRSLLRLLLIRDLIKAKNNLLPYRNGSNNLTFKDLKKRVCLETTQQQQLQLTDRLQNKPFWIWDVQEHKQEDIRTNGDCCFNHIIGLPQKDGVDKPLYTPRSNSIWFASNFHSDLFQLLDFIAIFSKRLFTYNILSSVIP